MRITSVRPLVCQSVCLSVDLMRNEFSALVAGIRVKVLRIEWGLNNKFGKSRSRRAGLAATRDYRSLLGFSGSILRGSLLVVMIGPSW